MTNARTRALEEVVEDLRRVLTKCDKLDMIVPAIYVDMAINLATSERDRELASA